MYTPQDIADIRSRLTVPPRRKALAIVATARMTSDRFPGKVILPLAGMPTWWHLLKRGEMAARATGAEIAGMAIITSKEPNNDILEAQARQYGFDCIRHDPEYDLPGRRLKAMDYYDVDVLIDGSCDSPFSWWEHVPLQIAPLWETGYLATPKWITRKRDPAHIVTYTVGTLGIAQRANLELQRAVAQSANEIECSYLTTRDHPDKAALLAMPPIPRALLFDYPDEMYTLYRWWTVEVDSYEDGVTACVLYDALYNPKTHLVDARDVVRFVDCHPEWHYNRDRSESAVNRQSLATQEATRDAAWLAYCEQYIAPEHAQKLRCKTCGEYLGYVAAARSGIKELHRPDGSTVTGHAQIMCMGGHTRVWEHTLDRALTSGSLVTA